MNTTKIQSIEKIKQFLPSGVRSILNKLDNDTLCRITELRLRADSVSTVTLGDTSCAISLNGLVSNTKYAIKVTKEELDSFIFRLCKGSVYSYEPTIKEGYITRFGIRVGLCGEYSQSGDKSTFTGIRSVNIRLPRHVDGCSRELINYIEQNGLFCCGGILVSSAPGVGKTTLLRDIAQKLSTGIIHNGEKQLLRVCVIDERSEIYMDEVFSESSADFMTGISKAHGIDIATRVLSPQVIICDEIGTQREANEILHANSGGVVLIASVHADSKQAILAKPHIKALIDQGVFNIIYMLSRDGSKVNGEIISLCEKQRQ